MKIACGSDFHFEFYGEDKVEEIIIGWEFEPGTDLMIIAGDLHVGAKKVIECLQFIAEIHDIFVVYVPGNHEYYHSSFVREDYIFNDHGLVTKDYIILLHNHIIQDGVMIFGCYGNLDGSYENISKTVHGALSDFHLITDYEARISRGMVERMKLENSLAHAIYDTAVVVTHTMPSPKCISDQYRGSYLNGCFANNWEREIVKYKPQYWICGHTHDRNEVTLDETLVIMNPKGYPRENKSWEWRYINV